MITAGQKMQGPRSGPLRPARRPAKAATTLDVEASCSALASRLSASFMMKGNIKLIQHDPAIFQGLPRGSGMKPCSLSALITPRIR